MNLPSVQIRERSPTLVKERFYVAGGIILIILSVILLFFSVPVADIVYLLGAIISIAYTVKQYKSFKQHHVISKAGIVWQSIITGAFVIVGFFIMLIVNFFWLTS